MCFNFTTTLLNLELYIVSEYRHYAKQKHSPWKKKHKKHSSPSKKSKSKKKSTMVLLKALTTIPDILGV